MLARHQVRHGCAVSRINAADAVQTLRVVPNRASPEAAERKQLLPHFRRQVDSRQRVIFHDLHIQPRIERIVFDESAAGFDDVAHEDAEQLVRGAEVFHFDL